MTRRCSHCGHDGHNSRTCPNRGVKIFGVHLTDGSIRKSASMGNLSLMAGAGSGGEASPIDGDDQPADGYASDDCAQGSSSAFRDRKKGTPWTEEEHRRFLIGLQKLGKGDWRGISRNYVVSRTPTQVASHAQKYFIRQSNVQRKRRRSSLFDMVPEEAVDISDLPNLASAEPVADEPVPPQSPLEADPTLMNSSVPITVEQPAAPSPAIFPPNYGTDLPVYFPQFLQFHLPFCTNELQDAGAPVQRTHEIVKPVAVHSAIPSVSVDELVGMSRLTIGEHGQEAVSTSLSLTLPGGQHRQSAFTASPAARAQA